jgi:RHS repeat-associated protein
LSDGTHDYIYGNGRIAQVNGSNTEHFLGDALGSVRQLTDAGGAVAFAQGYDPYGTVAYTAGGGGSSYGFTNEYQSQGLVYLRARHYAPSIGRFLTRDTWNGDANRPMSFNGWAYVEGNPINYTDPSGLVPYPDISLARNRPLNIMPPMAPINSTLEYAVSFVGHAYECENSFAKALRLIAVSEKERIEAEYGVKLTSEDKNGVIISTSNWALPDLSTVELAMRKIAFRLQVSVRENQVGIRQNYMCRFVSCAQRVSGKELFRGIFGGLELRRGPKDVQYVPTADGWKIWGKTESSDLVRLYGPEKNWGYGTASERIYGIYLIQHELGHVIDKRMNGYATNRLTNSSKSGTELSKIISTIIAEETKEGSHPNKIGPLSGLGINMRSAVRHPIKNKEGEITGYVPAYGEFFADAFASWANNYFVYSDPKNLQQQNGKAWRDFIDPFMLELVSDSIQ